MRAGHFLGICVLLLNLASAQGAGPDIGLRVRAIPIDPAIARLTAEQLIDRLQLESQSWIANPPPVPGQGGGGSHLETPSFERAFMPLDSNAQYEGNRSRSPRSPAMTELVRRGVASLPTLLIHLTDARPTGVLWNPPFNGKTLSMIGGPVGLGDVYDPRFLDEARWPKHVNTARTSGYRPLDEGQYQFKVADLCYAAIGQIVNRELLPRGSYLSGASLVMSGTSINSPIEYPELVRATRQDWGFLTETDHERSLVDDALRLDSPNGHPERHAWGGIQRLLYYYPNTGRRVVGPLLERRLVGPSPEHVATTGEVFYQDQIELLSALEPFAWDELDVKLYHLFCKTAEGSRQDAEDLLYSGRLAYECAKRIIHQGHDEELRAFFEQEITRMEASLPTPSGRAYRYALGEEIKSYHTLLASL